MTGSVERKRLLLVSSSVFWPLPGRRRISVCAFTSIPKPQQLDVLDQLGIEDLMAQRATLDALAWRGKGESAV